MNLLLIRFSIVKVISSQKLKLNVCEVNKAFIVDYIDEKQIYVVQSLDSHR